MPHGQELRLRHFALGLATKKPKNDFKKLFLYLSRNLSFPSQNETCLVHFMVLKLTLISRQLFYRAIYLKT